MQTIKEDSLIEFQTLAEHAPVMLWLTNSEGEIIFSNSKWKRFVGGKKVESEGGNAWYQALHPDDRERCVEIFKNAFSTHNHFDMEYRLKRNDGSYRNVLDTGEPYISENGSFSGFIGSSIDVTEQKCFESRLKRSHMDMEQHNIEMRLVNKLNSYLQVCRTLEETYPVIFYYARELFPKCVGSLYLLNDSKTVVESVVSWGINAEQQMPVITPDDCWALRQGKSHIVADINHGLICKHLNTCPEYGYSCVPIIAQGDMVGMIHLQYPKLDDNLTTEEINQSMEAKQRLVNMTADNLALALVSLKLREALKTQSIVDPLTKIFNRRYMEETIEREYSRCKRTDESLGFIMLDIDNFKSINDNHGHDAGDMILHEVANLMQNKLRKGDIACRYGGEEFVLIMPSAPLYIVEQKAELFRAEIERLSISYQNNVYENMTVSIGVSLFPEHADSIESLIKAADEALYKAKNGGRNKVVVANELARRKTDDFSNNTEKLDLLKASNG